MTSFLVKFAIVLIASCAISTLASAQNKPQAPSQTPLPADAAAPCLPAKKITAAQLHGWWTVQFVNPPAGLPAQASMRLERHEEFSESLAGEIHRDLTPVGGKPAPAGHKPRAQLAGDLEDGLFLLDESSNGTSITATWNGELVEGSCGKTIKGVWKDTSNSAPPDAADVPFTLTRRQGW